MKRVVIGVDPHKLSATIEIVDQRENVLGSGRFTTNKAGFAAIRKYVNQWPDRTWAVQGSLGVGRPLAQRLLEAGERVVAVFAALAVTRLIEDRTGWSIKKFVRTARRYHTVQIRAGQHLVNAEQPLPTELRTALGLIN